MVWIWEGVFMGIMMCTFVIQAKLKVATTASFDGIQKKILNISGS